VESLKEKSSFSMDRFFENATGVRLGDIQHQPPPTARVDLGAGPSVPNVWHSSPRSYNTLCSDDMPSHGEFLKMARLWFGDVY